MKHRRASTIYGMVTGACVLSAIVLCHPREGLGKDRVTVYHPSPFGKYDYLRLFPRPALSNPCQIGMLYTEQPDRLRFCGDDGTGTGVWRDVAGGVWEQNGDFIHPRDASNPKIQVMIGTTTVPALSSRLTIEGSDPAASPVLTRLLLRNRNAGSRRSLIHFKSGLASGGWKIGTDLNHNGGDDFFLFGDGAARLYIDAAGHIGLNTTNPTRDLDLAGNAEMIIEAPAPSLELMDTNNVDFKIFTDTDNRVFWAFNDGSGYKPAFVLDADTGHVGLGTADRPQGRFHLGDPTGFQYDYASDPVLDRLRGHMMIEGGPPALVLIGQDSAATPSSAALMFPQVNLTTGAYVAAWALGRETSANGGDLFISFAEGNDDLFDLKRSKLRLTTTGRLSIGPVAVPQADLHVYNGNIELQGLDGSSVLTFSGTDPNPKKTFSFSRTPGIPNELRIAGNWPVTFTIDLRKNQHRIAIGRNALRDKSNKNINKDTLYVAGRARKDSGGNKWATPSDARLKTNIVPIKDALAWIEQLRGVRFRWKTEPDVQAPHFGFIAQEVETVFPEWVDTDDQGYKTLNTSDLDALLVGALQELDERLRTLESETGDLLRKVEGP